jgi:hypothetical protein
MSNELERAFATLTEDTTQVRLTPAADLRRRTDRRQAATRAVGAAAAVVMVAGAVFGARLALAGPDRPMPAPADTARPPSPAPASPPPSSTPSSAPPSSSAPALPRSIPARAFLQESDMPGTAVEKPLRLGPGDQDLPDFCGGDYENAGRTAVRATQRYAFQEADAPAGSTPKAAAYEDVIVFRGAGAAAFMEDLRDAVRSCPSSAGERTNHLRGGIGAGDESVLIEQARPAFGDDGEPVGDGTLHRLYWAAVRVGDTVGFVAVTGWESVSAERADTVHLGERAAARIADWR